MAENKVRHISKKQFVMFIGLTLFLLSIVLTLNVWVIARTLTFVFTYLFGIASYLIYAFLFFEGIKLMVKKEFSHFKLSLRFFGILLTFFSTCLLINTFTRVDISLEGYTDYFSSLNYIGGKSFLNLFDTKISGGITGLAFFDILDNVATPVPYIIGFLLLSVGLAFTFMNSILAIFSIAQEKSKNKEQRKVIKEASKPSRSLYKEDKIIQDNNEEDDKDNISLGRDYSSSVIKKASMLSDDEDKPIQRIVSSPNNVNQNNSINNSQNLNESYHSDLSFRNNGVFTPAHFVPGVIPGDFPSAVMNPIQPNEEPQKQNEPQIQPQAQINNQQQINTPINNVNRPREMIKEEPQRREEQLTLNFDGPQIDQQIVTAKPTFEDPVARSRNDPSLISNPTPIKKKIKWIPPSNALLETYETSEALEANTEVAEQRMALINQIFIDFKVRASIENYVIGPSVTRYNIKYEPNVPYRAVENIVKDIAIRLGGVAVRFEAIVEGSPYSGLEIPNARITTVSFKDVYDALPDVKKHPTAIAFGKNILGEVISADFNSFPHILVAGTTGSGKSIFIHSIISTLIMRNSPDMLKLVLVDPKRVEMVKYRDIPHLLCPIVNEPHKAKPLLDKLVEEMNKRYDKLAEGDGFQDIKEYNEYAEEHGLEKIPTIIAILDEYGDLVNTCKEISQPVILIGQKARACGIHMLIATQSPSTDIITGSIKSNLPTHVALRTANSPQSVIILNEGGAEKLLGKGDMLVQSPVVSTVGLVRAQGCYIQGKEISRICGYLREHYETQYDENFLNLEEEATQNAQMIIANGGTIGGTVPMDNQEELKYQSIKSFVMTQQYTSISKIQRDCSVGFNRAGRIFNRLVNEGIVSNESEGNKGSKVLVHDGGANYDSDDNIPVSDEQSEI